MNSYYAKQLRQSPTWFKLLALFCWGSWALALAICFMIFMWPFVLSFLAISLVVKAVEFIYAKLATQIKWAIWRHRIHRS